MATGGIVMQSTECPVCHKNYHQPKILPCAHLLCRSCLVTWMKKKTDALCPLCCSAIVERGHMSSRNCEDIVDSLLTDHAMSAMVESVKILNEQRVCHVHRGVGATSLCLHCNLKLCQTCVEVHKNLPLTSFHKVEDLGTITLQSLASNRQEPCSDHPDKISELFCIAHNVLICQLCATSKHRTCPEVTCLKEVNEKYKQRLSDIKVKLTSTVSDLNRAITQIEGHLATSNENTQAAFKQIDATCNALLNSVETCRKRLKKLVQDADDKIKATALEQKLSVDKRRGTLTSHLNSIERLQNTASGSTLVAMVPELENRIAKLNFDTTVTWQGFQMVRLTIDRQTQVLVEQALEKIGELQLSPAFPQGGLFVQPIGPWRNSVHNVHPMNIYPANYFVQPFAPVGRSDILMDPFKSENNSSANYFVQPFAPVGRSDILMDPFKSKKNSSGSKHVGYFQEKCRVCLTLDRPEKYPCNHELSKCYIKPSVKLEPHFPEYQRDFDISTGNQPEDGRMSYVISLDKNMAGVTNQGAIVIDYFFPDGTQQACHPHPGASYKGISCTAYLPNTVEGHKVLKMLEIAFKQRLVFTIADSFTKGVPDVVTWNGISHKTSFFGGPSSFGYPDPDYLKRVKEELAAKGITSPEGSRKVCFM